MKCYEFMAPKSSKKLPEGEIAQFLKAVQIAERIFLKSHQPGRNLPANRQYRLQGTGIASLQRCQCPFIAIGPAFAMTR
jgi:hypothetical protein